ncbi:transcriptional regulator [Streptomyces sp. JH002]|uniref:transcriptional regulator n=1 Tax=Streptomyces sp. JH002 TaxID=2763259 RepID=UPI003D806A83
MHDPLIRSRAVALARSGASHAEIGRLLDIPSGTIGYWVRLDGLPSAAPARPAHRPCPRCDDSDLDHAAYAYLLGLYLGDGHITRSGRTYVLRIACGTAWPGLIRACERAITAIRPANRVCRARKQGCVLVTAYSNHWPCLFPQHGPGRKHERAIVLEPWQRSVVSAHRWEFVRGLIHSDGCRVVNRTTKTIAGEPKRYEYPRYFFTNTSDDIIGLFTGTLDALGVEWKHLNQRRAAQTVSVARRGSVALMDAHVGAKY